MNHITVVLTCYFWIGRLPVSFGHSSLVNKVFLPSETPRIGKFFGHHARFLKLYILYCVSHAASDRFWGAGSTSGNNNQKTFKITPITCLSCCKMNSRIISDPSDPCMLYKLSHSHVHLLFQGQQHPYHQLRLANPSEVGSIWMEDQLGKLCWC